MRSGPVFSRFDRFLLIGPRVKGGPALRLLTTANLHFLSKLLDCRAGAGPSVFSGVLRESPNRFSSFFQQFLKIQYKLALLAPPKITKTLLYNHLGIQIEQMLSLKMSLQSARSSLKKILEGPAVICKRGIRPQQKSE